MADKMDGAIDAICKALDGGMNILRQSLDRLASASVADIQRREAGGPERRLHFSKRSRRPADAMQQDDAVLPVCHSTMIATRSLILALLPPREIVGHVAGNLVLEFGRALFQKR